MISILEALINSQMYPKTDTLLPGRYAPWVRKYQSKHVLAKGDYDSNLYGTKEKPVWLTPKPQTDETKRQMLTPIARKEKH